MKKIVAVFISIIIAAIALAGCNAGDDTIQTCIISNTSYTNQNELEKADQPETLTANNAVYASVHVIESPKGMEYTVKWYIDDSEVKSETKATENDLQDIVVYELEAEQVLSGSLKFEVLYDNTILLTKELKIQ